jgi:hypothetical protein
MPFVVAVPLLKVRQSPWASTPPMRNPAYGRADCRFNFLGQAAVSGQIVAADYNVLSRPS